MVNDIGRAVGVFRPRRPDERGEVRQFHQERSGSPDRQPEPETADPKPAKLEPNRLK